MTEGVININKPADWTSQDVCAKLRGRLHIKKNGHTGTLDPMATGVLPVCIGRATRFIEYYDADFKTYRAVMKLGRTSDTLDSTGTITGQYDFSNVSEADIRAALNSYTGEISQIPPKYSALKVNGRRAYDIARSGGDVELKSRIVTIASNELVSLDPEEGTAEFVVKCSKGTYIRTICDDIGRTLGCGAIMTSLERTGSGFFGIDDSYDLDKVINMTDTEIEACIIPVDETLVNLGIIELDTDRMRAFCNGNSSGSRCYSVTEEPCVKFSDVYRVYSDGRFLGTGRTDDRRELVPVKVIND